MVFVGMLFANRYLLNFLHHVKAQHFMNSQPVNLG